MIINYPVHTLQLLQTVHLIDYPMQQRDETLASLGMPTVRKAFMEFVSNNFDEWRAKSG